MGGYKLTLKESTPSSETTIKIDRENISSTVLIDQVFKTLIVDKVWDSHGDLVNFNDSETPNGKLYKNAKVTIIAETNKIWFNREKNDFIESEDWDIIVDGEKLNGSVNSYRGTKNALRVKLIVGWG